jgi:predicted nucleic acid-binding protein
VILIDSNVLMYAAGARHPHKEPSASLLERIAAGRVEAFVDAEILQEILHRYRAINRWSDGRRVYDLTRSLILTVVPITAEIVDGARSLLDTYSQLMASDALHASVCREVGARGICSYDSDFDVVRGLRRIEPQQV